MFTDDQRRRRAAKGKPVGRRALREIGSIVKPTRSKELASGRSMVYQQADRVRFPGANGSAGSSATTKERRQDASTV